MRKIIYLEIDEEITSVIDKLRKVEENEAALVVPKNASLVQSIVNLKLLKKQSADLGKEISLVTTDKIGRNLASQIGITVYQRLDKKTFDNIPTKEESVEEFKEAEEEKPQVEIVYKEAEEKEKELKIEKRPILPEKEKKKKKKEEKEKKKGLKILSKKKIIFVFLFIVLLIMTIGFLFIPRTQATLFIRAEKISLDKDFIVKKDEKKVDLEKSVIPGKLEEVIKEGTEKFQATGKKNIGEKAKGTITVYNKTGIDQIILAGSNFVSNSLIYTSDTTINVPRATVSLDAEGNPIISPGSVSVGITASSPGEDYNTSSSTFTIPSLPVSSDKVYGQGGPISGGSSKEVTVVSQDDIDKAETELTNTLYEQAEKELKEKVSSEYKLVEEAIKKSVTESDGQSKIDVQVSEFELNIKVSVSVLVFKIDDLKKLIEKDMELEISQGKELMTSGIDSSLNSGDEPQFKIAEDKIDEGQITFNLNSNAYLVPKIDQDKLKEEVNFKSENIIKDSLDDINGVEKVEVKFWPSFIKISPLFKSRIEIKIEIFKE